MPISVLQHLLGAASMAAPRTGGVAVAMATAPGNNPARPRRHQPQSLATRLGIDMVAAMCTAFAITPFILTIDKAVCDAAVGRSTMRQSVSAGVRLLLTRPHLYVTQRAYAFVFAIYTATYATANFASTWATDVGNPRDPAMPKFLATTAVNVPLSVLQDRFFVQWFGAARVRPVAIPTYLCWALRDSATICGSFALPAKIAPFLQKQLGLSDDSSVKAAQLLVPSLVSVFIHPSLHLLGIDMYNRPKLSLRARLPFISDFFVRTGFMRFCRIMPAFGAGGIVNLGVRDTLRSDCVGDGGGGDAGGGQRR